MVALMFRGGATSKRGGNCQRIIKNRKNFLGFSVAEAMVTLLIASVALSVVAPILTKRNKQIVGNGSRWTITNNGSDISRIRGKVGIGVPANSDPDGILEVRSSALNTNNLITIKRGNTEVFSVNELGGVVINIPSTDQDAFVVKQNGTTNAYVKSNGNAQFTLANLFRATGAALQIGTNAGNINTTINADGTVTINKQGAVSRAISIRRNGTETGFINSDGSTSFLIPANAVMFFWAEKCPTGWSPLTSRAANVADGYIRIVGETNSNLGSVRTPILPDIQATFSGVGQRYNKSIGSGTYTGAMRIINESNAPAEGALLQNTGSQRDDYIGFRASWYNNIYQDGNDVHPKNISLLACIKNP